MATLTSPLRSSDPSGIKKKPTSPEEVVEKLKMQLSRFTRASDKRLVVRSIQNCRYLQSIPLEKVSSAPSSQQEWKELENQVCSHSININGLIMAPSNEMLAVLKHLCEQLCLETKLSVSSLYHALLVRLAHPMSATDCYFALNTLLGSQELALQELKNPPAVPPTKLTLYQADGSIHASLQIFHPLGLFRKMDVNSGKAWIFLQASVKERVNLSTGEACRQVSVKVDEENTKSKRY